MILIDGSFGEGGGQIVRSALSLSLLTGQAFRVKNIRAGRKSKGLLRQHLTALQACALIGRAKCAGAELGSSEFTFEPKALEGGEYRFAIGSAGSTSLVAQTVLLPLLAAKTASRVVIEGGTHNSASPPFDFLQSTFLPILRALGANVSLSLERAGFYPAGGGRIVLEVEPSQPKAALALRERGKLLGRECRAVVAGLSGDIAKRELAAFKSKLSWDDSELRIVQERDEAGPGNVMIAELRFENVAHTFAAFGERNVRSHEVAENLATQVEAFLSHEGAADPHLADQLLLPSIWAAGGAFTTHSPTKHFTTNMALIKQFIRCECSVSEGAVVEVEVRKSDRPT